MFVKFFEFKNNEFKIRFPLTRDGLLPKFALRLCEPIFVYGSVLGGAGNCTMDYNEKSKILRILI